MPQANHSLSPRMGRKSVLDQRTEVIMNAMSDTLESKPNKGAPPLKIAVIGLGHRACHYGSLPFVGENATICGVCESDKQRLTDGAAIYSSTFKYNVPGFLSCEELFDRTKPDGVYISTPNNTHCEIAVAAMQRGIHVLCEKPLDISLARCDKIIAAAKSNRVILATGMQMNYRKRYHRIQKMIQEGVIGEPVMTWCVDYRHPFREGKKWVWDSELSGGSLVEKNCHHCDIMDMWMGGSNPVSVYATGNIRKHHAPHGYESNIVDNAYVVYDYENGARGMLEISFLMENVHDRQMGVQGTEGRLWVQYSEGERIHVVQANGKTFEVDEPGELRGGLFRDFLDCIAEGNEPLVGGAKARQSLLVPLAGEISMAEKRVVQISELESTAKGSQ